jgi:uncharacterized membrane protein
MSKSRLLLILCGLAFAAHMLWIYPALPETVASHFDTQGNPNGWMGKQVFLIFEVVLLMFVVGEFLLAPWFIGRMPNSLINLPNKAYWLADERRGETFAIFRSYFEVFGAVILILFTVVNHFVYLANIKRQNLSNNVWFLIVAFLVFVGIWVIRFIREFRLNK